MSNLLHQSRNRFKKLKKVFLDTGKEYREMEILQVKFFKNMVILKFKGIENINFNSVAAFILIGYCTISTITFLSLLAAAAFTTARMAFATRPCFPITFPMSVWATCNSWIISK